MAITRDKKKTLVAELTDLFSSAINRKETEHDGNNQKADNGSIK